MTITPAITGRATMKVTHSSVIMTAPAAAPAFTRAAIRRGILHTLHAAAARQVLCPTAAPLCSIVSQSTEAAPSSTVSEAFVSGSYCPSFKRASLKPLNRLENFCMPSFSKDRSIRKVFFSVVVFLFVIGFCQFALAQAPQPHFKVDPYWPKELPNNWIIGQVGGMFVDGSDHIWVFQRPASNTPDEISADPSSPRHAMCCFPAPPVLEFDTEGTLLKSWGGPGSGYDWPKVEHGIQ